MMVRGVKRQSFCYPVDLFYGDDDQLHFYKKTTTTLRFKNTTTWLKIDLKTTIQIILKFDKLPNKYFKFCKFFDA